MEGGREGGREGRRGGRVRSFDRPWEALFGETEHFIFMLT
jgi:hypothetical protein